MMVQEFVSTLESSPMTSWLVILGRIVAFVVNAIDRFLDNERAFIHGLMSVGMLIISIHLFTNDTLDSSHGYVYFRLHWPFTETGWAWLVGLSGILCLSALFIGKHPDHEEESLQWMYHRLATGYQVAMSLILLGNYATIAWGFHFGNKEGIAYYFSVFISIVLLWVAVRVYRRDGIWT